MLRCIPDGWGNPDYKILNHGSLVAVIEGPCVDDESGVVLIEGTPYRFHCEGVGSGKYSLSREGVSATAKERDSLSVTKLSVEFEEHHYTLKKRGIFKSGWELLDDNEVIGSIYSMGFFSKETAVDLPENIPIHYQVFMVWLTLVISNQSEGTGAGGG